MGVSGVLCPQCGASNKPVDLFCTSCGARLAAAPPPPPPATTAVRRAPRKGRNLPLLVAAGAVIVLLIVVVVEGLIIFLPLDGAGEVGATLAVPEGRAFVQQGGRGYWTEVADGSVVQAGDRIRVADGSKAVLTFVEGTTTELRALTELGIEELELAGGRPVLIKLHLEVGEIWNRVAALPADSQHEIRTMAAKMTCHGSEYGAAANQAGTTWLTGHEGEIEVTAAGQTVELGPGEALVVELGSPPVPYEQEAAAGWPPVEAAAPSVCDNLGRVELPWFGNAPVPTGTPTNTPTATATRQRTRTPTPTTTATPTATSTRVACPTLTINAPSGAYPRRIFGIEWDCIGAPVPPGWGFAVEFTQDPSSAGSWQRAQPTRVWQEGGHWHAELHGPGAGVWYWRICLAAEPMAPSQCCGQPHPINHYRDEEGEEQRYYDY